jgi:hypothetical protein
MSISTPPPPAPPKKRGLGCLGCGCLVLVLLLVLVIALIAATGYMTYTQVLSYSTTTPASVPSSHATDDDYQAARHKLADFDHDLQNHQAATIQLSGDEINALIERDPDITKNNIQAFVTLDGAESRLQATVPVAALSNGLVTGRYFNFDATFDVHLDAATKSLLVNFDTLKFGDKTLLNPASANNPSTRPLILWYTAMFNQSINASIRKSPDGAALLDEAKSIEIQNGQLVISTQ